MPDGSSECGTAGAVKRHKREGTDPCPGDREALLAYQREWRAKRKARAARREAEATRRAQGERAVRARLEAVVLAKHEAGELVLG
jgi:hypothetical protein